MKSVLGLQSISTAEVSDKTASPENVPQTKISEEAEHYCISQPADAGGFIPENIELVYGAELAEEFLEFVLKRRTFEACQQLVDKVHHTGGANFPLQPSWIESWSLL